MAQQGKGKGKGPVKEKAEEQTIEIVRCRLKQTDFDDLIHGYEIDPVFEPELPSSSDTALCAPVGKITLYKDFFSIGNFRLPITRFVLEVLSTSGLHITQIHPLSMARLRHFEYVCRCKGVAPTMERLMVFYSFRSDRRGGGWYSLVGRSKVATIASDPPRSLHDWKSQFFFISAEAIPLAMRFLQGKEVPEVKVGPYEEADWFKAVSAKATPLREYAEYALVLLGMSRIWEDPKRVPIIKDNGVGKYFLFIFMRKMSLRV